MFSDISRGRPVPPASIFLSMIDFTPSRVAVGMAALPNGPMVGAYAPPPTYGHPVRAAVPHQYITCV